MANFNNGATIHYPCLAGPLGKKGLKLVNLLPIRGIFFLMESLMIVMGTNETPWLGEGWDGLERSPAGMLYRAARENAWLQLPPASGGEIKLLLSARPEHAKAPLRWSVRCGGHRHEGKALAWNGWVIRCLALGPVQEGIWLETHNPWSPDQLYQNGDARQLGLLVSAICWQPAV